VPDDTLTQYDSAGGTREAVTPAPHVDEEPPAAVASWLRSNDARTYEGFWVLLGRDFEPVDSDLSPTALRLRHRSEPGVILFVEPRTGLVDY
jgi:hypothetical protein